MPPPYQRERRGYLEVLCHQKPVTLNYPESTPTRGEKRPRKDGKGRQLRRFHFARRVPLTSGAPSAVKDFSIASPSSPPYSRSCLPFFSTSVSQGDCGFWRAYQSAESEGNGVFGVDSFKCSIPTGGSAGAESNCQNDLR